MINATRGYCLVVAASALCATFAGAEIFNCDQAARFGYADSLCEKPEKSIRKIVERQNLDDPPETTAPYSRNEGRDSPVTQADSYRHSERANQRAWENYRSWNPMSPIYPYAAYRAGEWSALELPPILLQRPSPPGSQASKPKLFGP